MDYGVRGIFFPRIVRYERLNAVMSVIKLKQTDKRTNKQQEQKPKLSTTKMFLSPESRIHQLPFFTLICLLYTR